MSELSTSPALITKVIPDSIAAEIGFEAGDRHRRHQRPKTPRLNRLSIPVRR